MATKGMKKQMMGRREDTIWDRVTDGGTASSPQKNPFWSPYVLFLWGKTPYPG